MNTFFSEFLSKINLRLILVHFAACWLFIYAFQTLVYLHDRDFLLQITYHRPKTFDSARLSVDLLWIGLSSFAGLITAFAISLAVSLKRKWAWENSVIILVIVFPLMHANLLGWDYLSYIFLSPSLLIKPVWCALLVDGVIMITVGILLFLLKRVAVFIADDKGIGNISA